MSTPIPSAPAEFAALLAEATTSAERALDEARIPIHILLSAQFGELNENQEEMLDAAAKALYRIAQELRTLHTIADADGGATNARRDAVRVADILSALQPELRAQAQRAGVSLTFDIEPALPSAQGRAASFRDALRLTLTDEIRYALPGTTVAVQAKSSPTEVIVTSRGNAARSVSGSLVLADRLLRAQGGRLDHDGGDTTITLLRAQPGVPRAA